MGSFAYATILIFPSIIEALSARYKGFFGRGGAYGGALGFALLTGVAYLQEAPIELIPLNLTDGFSLGWRLDLLSGLVSTAVMLIGASIMKYSVRYMADDPNRKTFHLNLSTTLTCVLLMLNASNLIMFWLAWVGTSFFLHKLLLHFKDRPEAQKAAHQKFWVSRTGDVFVVLASVILYKVFGTLDFGVFSGESLRGSLQADDLWLQYLAGTFLVLGAMTKSAQFPFHFWLPKTMETPTPVSALMHAGIINAGGFLIVRMGGFLNEIPLALNLLAVIGGVTAFYGSILMLAQTDIKKSLAFSTISQMGFMMLQCGLGAFSIAVVHIVGHAFYKAYSFLGSGATTDFAKLNRYLSRPRQEDKVWTPFIVGFAMVSISLTVGPWLGYGYQKPGALVLLIVLGLASAQIFLAYENKIESLKKILILYASYFALFHGVDHLLSVSIMTSAPSVSFSQHLINALVSALLIGLFLIQNNLERLSRTRFGQRLYTKSLNGGFIG